MRYGVGIYANVSDQRAPGVVQCPPHPNSISPNLNIDIMASNSQTGAAIADLDTQEVKNFSAMARKYGVNRSTLIRRYKNKQGTRQEAIIE